MKKIIVNREPGEFGIGSLIMFIAMIIVAAVTATLLINTSYQLQQQAQSTSQEAMQDVSTGLKVISMGGYRYNSTWGTEMPYHSKLDWITLKVTLIAGSPPVNISEIILVVTDGYTVATLSYDPSASFTAGAHPPALGNDQFGATLIRNLPPTETGLITQGDIAELFFNATEIGLNLQPQSQLSVKIIPKHGVPTEEVIMTPSVYIARYVELV